MEAEWESYERAQFSCRIPHGLCSLLLHDTPVRIADGAFLLVGGLLHLGIACFRKHLLRDHELGVADAKGRLYALGCSICMEHVSLALL